MTSPKMPWKTCLWCRPMKRLGIAEALRECIRREMSRDEHVFCIGEDIAIPGGWGGAFTVTLGLEEHFPDRMINMDSWPPMVV